MPLSDRRLVATGSAWTGLAWGVNTVTGPLLAVLLVRSMTHRTYGALALATDAVGLIAAALSFGLGPAVTQVAVTERVRVGPAGERMAVGRALRLAAVATGFAVPCVAAVSLLFLFDSELRPAFAAFCVMTPIALLAPTSGVLMGTFRALQWPRLLAYTMIAGSVTTAMVILILIDTGSPGSISVGVAFDVRPLVALPFLAWPLVRWWRSGRRMDQAGTPGVSNRRIVSLAVAFMLAMTFGVAISQLDVLVLGAFHGARLTGLYSPASAIGTFVMAMPLVVASFYLPVVTRLAAEQDRVGISDLYHWATRVSLALSAPVLAVALICPGALLEVVFGPSLSVEAMPLRIIGIGALLNVTAGFNGITLDAQGLVRLTTKRILIALGISAVACLVLVPPLGAIGAATATAIGLLGDNLICSGTLLHRYRLLPWDRRTAAVAAALVVSLGIGWLIQRGMSSNVARCAATAICAGVIVPGVAVLLEDKRGRQALARLTFKRMIPMAPDPSEFGGDGPSGRAQM
ncbi:MAG: lipopolysaccharide biosynthesis protein [Acidimicrobiales bacterium]